jgi:predicted O-linked N-acetylglucosamine transferase (SPINDLY family)
LQRYAEAIEAYDRALALAPDNTLVLNNRGAALNEIKLHEEALATFDLAVALAPDYAEAYYNRGNALKGLRRIAEALESYEKALEIGTPLPHVFSGFAECAAKICDWGRAAEVEAELESHVLAAKSIVSPFTLIGYGAPLALQLKCARAYTAHLFPTLPSPMCGPLRRAHDRLRIAYLPPRHGLSDGEPVRAARPRAVRDRRTVVRRRRRQRDSRARRGGVRPVLRRAPLWRS